MAHDSDKTVLHITSGDIAGGYLAEAGLPGTVFVWHDILYDGPRIPGWPDDEALRARALFLEDVTGGGLDSGSILRTLQHQYTVLQKSGEYETIVLWFDACLFDQSMLVHILACLDSLTLRKVELLCIDAFPGIEPFHGLGQLQPGQLASLYTGRSQVSEAVFQFAIFLDRVFADRDRVQMEEISKMPAAPLQWVPAAMKRWLQEQPDPVTGLGRLERLALDAIRTGLSAPGEILNAVARADTPPQYWGDTTLWQKINNLARRTPPLVAIEGPAPLLPQWPGELPVNNFRVTAL